MNKLFIAILLSFFIEKLGAQSDTSLLKQKVEDAELVFEGRVVAQKSFWNQDSTTILTSNQLVPLKWFKGSYHDTIEILTMGGRLDGRFVYAEHTFQLANNTDYFLFLKQKDSTFFKAGRPSYFPTSVKYGVVIIFANIGNSLELEQIREHNYDDIINNLYKPVATIVELYSPIAFL